MHEIKNSQITLSVSCVYYDTSPEIFEATLESIANTIDFAIESKSVGSYEIYLINNNIEKEAIFLTSIDKFKNRLSNIIIYKDHGNIGYGKANNLAINATKSKYHLILNPDVETAKDAISVGLNYLEQHEAVGMVAPHAVNENGDIEYLAKRMPNFLVIFLRGINNKKLNAIFKEKLKNYTYRDKIPSKTPFEIELASGCFMLCNTKSLISVGGFSKNYFLYFEDFDLSKKIHEIQKIVYLPEMKIVHFGGYSSHKGSKHKFLFVKSAILFLLFNKYISKKFLGKKHV